MTEPVWCDERDALILHDQMLASDGGAAGLRDMSLLGSALARPRQLYIYGESPDTVVSAAAYTVSIVRNHPFVDGNKRTGFLLGIMFLEVNGLRFGASEEAAAQAVIELAAGGLDERGYAEFLRANTNPARKGL